MNAMPAGTPSGGGMSAVKLALLAQQVRQQMEGVNALAAEPIAIIGMGCRFPGGADSPEAYWDLLARGVDAIRTVPADRWDADAYYDADPYAAGAMNTRWGGFLDQVDSFDATFFGISPREAVHLDPQQRLVLEVAHEALERAGQLGAGLAGSLTGVFLAATLFDYGLSQFQSDEHIAAHTITGNIGCIIPNRLSYLLDLRGPSVAVDTACSSSLVAVHMACQSLRNRDSNMAIAGGVNVLVSPKPSISLSKWGLMAPDGRCKTFDASANGFVRSEGCGVIVLKRLADALADGDTVWGVIRGSAVNQDGRSTAMTAPNGLAQQDVVRQALTNAQATPEQITYIEAHGTGTVLGDPIEVEALTEVLGYAREGAPPVALASVKTNLGHLEAAAGIAGLIKVVLSMQHQTIPAHLHLKTLNPHITLDETRFYIPQEAQPWDTANQPRMAGVSSFGFGGTNAHVILEEAPRMPKPASDDAEDRTWPLLISAQSPAALRALAQAYMQHLSLEEGVSVRSIAATASLRRAHYDFRLALTGATRAELADRLRTYLADGVQPGMVAGEVDRSRRARLAFVFCGQGPQWWAMGRGLLARAPIFREVIERCDALFTSNGAAWSLLEELGRAENESRLGETEIAQPAIFAVQMGLAALWQAWSVAPDAVVGHSVGEIAAACVAGALSLEDATRLVYHRGRIMQRATGKGKMASVELPRAQVEPYLANDRGRVDIAATNAPALTVISGEPAAVDAVTEAMQHAGVNVRLLPVNYAFHSTQMAALQDELAQAVAGIAPRPAQIAIYSTVTGALIEGKALDAAYWVRNLREPVRFADATAALIAADTDVFLEIGPHPVLGSAMRQSLQTADRAALVTTSLRRGRAEEETMMAVIGELYVAGVMPDWQRLFPKFRGSVQLPTYPWQRTRYWFTPPALVESTAAVRASASTDTARGFALRRLRAPGLQGIVFETTLRADQDSIVGDHKVGATPILPATAYLALADAALGALNLRADRQIAQMDFMAPLALADADARTVQIQIDSTEPNARFQIFSLAGEEWTLHAAGQLQPVTQAADAAAQLDVAALQARSSARIAGDQLYADLAARNLLYGPAFRGAQSVWTGAQEVLGRIELPAALHTEQDAHRFHPAFLDAALHPLSVLLATDTQDTWLPFALQSLKIRRAPGTTVWSHIRQRTDEGGASATVTVDVSIHDESGALVAELAGLQLRALRNTDSARAGVAAANRYLYKTTWHVIENAPARPGAPARLLIIGDGADVGVALTQGDMVTPDTMPTVESLRTQLQEARAAGAPYTDVIHLRALDTPPLDGAGADVVAAQQPALESALVAIKTLAAETHAVPRLWLVTRGAQSTEGVVAAPEQATLLGIGTTVVTEHPELGCTLVDLDPTADAATNAQSLMQALALPASEEQVALRDGKMLAPRLTPLRANDAPAAPVINAQSAAADSTAETAQYLHIGTRGVLDNLTLEAQTRRAPAADEVEIRVRATGLNFRDVLNVLDLYPGEIGDPGEECSGEVVRVGANVQDVQVGDRVMGMASACFASYVTTHADLVIPVPPQLSFEDAATMPITFLTAWLALEKVAQLKRGERVLIHAAAGGVGMAAVQLAQRTGAEIFATAGSDEKRALLAEMGVDHIFDSRSLTFAEGVMAASGGQGVDVVLNSLSGDFITRSVDVLGQGGRFVEIGRRDIWSKEQMAATRPDVDYAILFLGDQARDEPTAIQAMLRELMAAFAAGEITPLPRRVFPLSEVVDAFRFMAQARHIGKVVVTQPATSVPVQAEIEEQIRADATYLITGGLGGLGLAAAQRLVARGARSLVLLGRSVAQEAAGEAVRALEEQGVVVRTLQVDVADAGALQHALDEIATTMAPLRGIIHAAGVNDDGVLTQQTWARCQTVFAPKLGGAWNLHTLTRAVPLDFFVLYASAATLIGMAAQGNYAAANAFLDALATQRTQEGLPALSIAWGPWQSLGMTARLNASEQERIAAHGLAALTPAQGMDAFEAALATRQARVAAFVLDEARLATSRPRALFAQLRPSAEPATPATQSFAETLRGTPAPQQRNKLLAHIRQLAIKVLGLPHTYEITPRQAFSDLGLDSLLAIELRNALSAALETTLPATLLFDYPTSDTLVTYLLKQTPALQRAAEDVHSVNGVVHSPAAPTAPAGPDLDDAALAELSDEEAEALLLAELEGRSS